MNLQIRKKYLFLGFSLIVLAFAAFSFPLDRFSGTSVEYTAVKENLRTDHHRGIAYFAFGDFSSLTSDTLRVSASPWKLVTAALALSAVDGDLDLVGEVDLKAIFRRFGFHSPESFGNWPEDLEAPEIQYPVGQNVGFAGRMFPPIGATIGNIGCAACHSSVMYDANGMPNLNHVWLGMPNGSINLEAYTSTLFGAMRDWSGDPDLLMAAVDRLYPETGWRENFTLRNFILPELKKTVDQRDAEIGRLLPFRASLAGATNGLDSLKNRLGLIPKGTVLEHSIFNSVPDLGGRLWRYKLLNTGTYAIPGIDHTATVKAEDINPRHRRGLAGIIAYFTVPSMGVTPEVAETSIEPAFWITDWMKDYKPQPFPGLIDPSLLAEGGEIYRNKCAECHGTYNDSLETPALTSFPNWEGNVGTDPQRARLLTSEISSAVNASLFGKYISARSVDTYAAPPLIGLWASAPYFHNGSVPTLWHMMNPETRPTRFNVGGHRLDLEKVGIAGDPQPDGSWTTPDGYTPWSEPALVDTTAFGLDSKGHEKEFSGLSDDAKRALLEYLKLL
ncbi:hypothetical protein [uncultured Roseibium sp.]|uniref:c-type cytochrome n=1 Tax=uncultured Roseibium sp. TaxID=1936171 RepID=UPI00260A4BA0|nr:hypothetical protein [uncultured Roseibium sp.]